MDRIWIMTTHLIFVPKCTTFGNLLWNLHLNLLNFNVGLDIHTHIYCPGSQGSAFSACTWCQLDPASSIPNDVFSLGGINSLHGFPINSSRTPLGSELAVSGQLGAEVWLLIHLPTTHHIVVPFFSLEKLILMNLSGASLTGGDEQREITSCLNKHGPHSV